MLHNNDLCNRLNVGAQILFCQGFNAFIVFSLDTSFCYVSFVRNWRKVQIWSENRIIEIFYFAKVVQNINMEFSKWVKTDPIMNILFVKLSTSHLSAFFFVKPQSEWLHIVCIIGMEEKKYLWFVSF